MSDDRRAAIEAAMSAAESKPAEAEAVVATEQPVGETAEAKVERERDERGRFAAKADPAEPVEPTQPAAAEPAKPPRQFPKTWKPALQDKFNTLDDEIYEEISRRESDMFKGLEQYQAKARRADEFERALQPFMATISSMGIAPEQAIQGLLASDHRLRYSNPLEKRAAILKMAQDYGIDLNEAAQGMPQIDPQYAALQQNYSRLENQLQTMLRQQQMMEQQSLQKQIQEFASKNPHFEAVKEDMAALLQAGRASDLQEAYDRAVWANPDTRKSMQTEQSAAAQAAERERAQKAATAARTAAVSVTGSPIAGASAPNPQDRRATIAAAMNRRA